MKLNIPTIGTHLVLAEDWHFTLYTEHRNETLFEVLGLPYKPTTARIGGNPPSTVVTLLKGTWLSVDRIYIRQGSPNMDSVTFRVVGWSTQRRKVMQSHWSYAERRPDGTYPEPERTEVEVTMPKRPVRFWAKLDDVNEMEVE
jgi:hypothetical protein